MDVICIGEALVDFLPERSGQRVADVEKWVRCSGGSPANVAVGVARLGGQSALVGCVGQDEFGDFLKESLGKEGVDVSHLRQTKEGKTGLVFVSLTETGERSFSFYRNRAAELFMSKVDVDPAFLGTTRAIHVGTNSLLWKDAQAAALQMVACAADLGRIVCCDPNLRLHLWQDPSELKALVRHVFARCSVSKLSEEEIDFVTGTKDPEAALRVMRQMGVLLPIVTLGEKGAVFLWREEVQRVPAPKVRVVDTTGAGDGFTAAFLVGLTHLYEDAAALQRADAKTLRDLAVFACAVGTKVVERLGAVTGLPRRDEVASLLPDVLR